MPTQGKRRRTMQELEAFIGFPPEGIREPFKPDDVEWSPRIPFGVGGMNRAVPADALQPDQAYTILNYRVGLGDLRPGFGTEEVGEARDDATEILFTGLYKESGGLAYMLRIDNEVLQYWNGSSWTEVTGDMTGDEDDRVRGAMVLNEFVFVNGVDEIQTWDGSSATYEDLSDDEFRPRRPRFLVPYADRLVVADVWDADNSVRDSQRVEWSLSGDIRDFTGTGSGGVTLHDGQVNAPADDIMGLAVQGNYMIVLRRNSIWLGFRTGEATLPIEFSSVVQGFGTIASGSVSDIDSTGVVYLGKDDVYLYHPQMTQPAVIGTPIRDRLFEVLDRSKIERVFSAYVPDTQEYWLFVPEEGHDWPIRAFVFSVKKFNEGRSQDPNFDRQLTWWEHEFGFEISAANNAPHEGLGAQFVDHERVLTLGLDDGSTLIAHEDVLCDDDEESFDMVFESPQFTSGPQKIQLVRLNIAHTTTRSLKGRVEFSTDGGFEWHHAATVAFPRSRSVKESTLFVPQGVTGDSIMFRLSIKRPDRCGLRLIGYRLGFVERGSILGHGG